MTGTIDILLVDDHQLVRDGLRLRLDAIEGFRVVGEASNMPDALSAIERLGPDLVLTDLSMKGGSGVALAARDRGVERRVLPRVHRHTRRPRRDA